MAKADSEQSPSRRSYTLVTNNAPRAVLGPTWESLLDTVPDSNHINFQNLDEVKRTSVILAPQRSVPVASPGSQPEAPSSTAFGSKSGNSAGGATPARSRRASQSGVNNRNSTHQPFAKSPLGSAGTVLGPSVQTNTVTDRGAAPGTVPANPGADSNGSVAAPTMGGMQTTPDSNNVAPVSDDDDLAAPAPTVMKWMPAQSTKSSRTGGKRRSIFGIPIGRREPVVTVQ